MFTHKNTLQHTATYCNTPQHTAPHFLTLQHTATQCHTVQHSATHCNTSLQHTTTQTCPKSVAATTHCNTLQHNPATHCNTPLQHTATQVKLLQHIPATHCNTLQHKPAPSQVAFARRHHTSDVRVEGERAHRTLVAREYAEHRAIRYSPHAHLRFATRTSARDNKTWRIPRAPQIRHTHI